MLLFFSFSQGPRSGGATSVLVTRKEERISFTLPGLESDEEDHDDDQKQISENEVGFNFCCFLKCFVCFFTKPDLVLFPAESSWIRQTPEKPPRLRCSWRRPAL